IAKAIGMPKAIRANITNRPMTATRVGSMYEEEKGEGGRGKGKPEEASVAGGCGALDPSPFTLHESARQRAQEIREQRERETATSDRDDIHPPIDDRLQPPGERSTRLHHHAVAADAPGNGLEHR